MYLHMAPVHLEGLDRDIVTCHQRAWPSICTVLNTTVSGVLYATRGWVCAFKLRRENLGVWFGQGHHLTIFCVFPVTSYYIIPREGLWENASRS